MGRFLEEMDKATDARYQLDPGKLRRILPQGPGAYLFKDSSGRVIYVGKAKSLKKRVLSYFKPADHLTPKTALMMKKARSLDFILTNTEKRHLSLRVISLENLCPAITLSSGTIKDIPVSVWI